MWSIIPDVCKALLITSTAATVITAGWLNPLNAFSDGITPEITADNKAVKATIS